MDGGKGAIDMIKSEAVRLFTSTGYAFGFLKYHWRTQSGGIFSEYGQSEDLPQLGLFLDIDGKVHLCFVIVEESSTKLSLRQQEHLHMISKTKNTAFVLFVGQGETDNSLYRFYDRKLLRLRQSSDIDSIWRELISTLRQGN